MNKNIVIFGAGISGLASAYWLNKDGFNVTVLECNSEAGGSMISRREKGYLVDYGPNSGLDTTPLIRQLVEEVGLADEMVYSNEKGNKRYILRNNQLHPLPMTPSALIKTKLFSTKGKIRLLAEPFIGKSEDGYYQSISQFVKRRLGQEFLDYAINPFVAGVYAGNPDELSVKSAFPKLYRLEEVYGGLIKGMIKGAKERKQRAEQSKQNAKMFSFTNGMQSFPRAIAKKLTNQINYECIVKSVERSGDKWKVLFKQKEETKEVIADVVLSTIPAYYTGKIFSSIDKQLPEHTENIYYPPVMVLYLGYQKKFIKQALDGFGFLIPKKENKSYLGAIWSSVIFPDRAEEDKASFTIFIGGARSPELLSLNKGELLSKVLQEFHSIMNITGDPDFIIDKLWQKAIPQYNIGYIEHEKYFDEFEKRNPGLFLSGNYRGGIAVGDCIKNSNEVYKKIINQLNTYNTV